MLEHVSPSGAVRMLPGLINCENEGFQRTRDV